MTSNLLDQNPKARIHLLVIILLPIFAGLGLNSAEIRDARKQDFAAYWQAGHMILSGQDVYDSAEWIAERELRSTALHSEPAFHYPLPFAVLFSPLALLPVQTAYGVWLFFELVALLTSVILLLNFYPSRGRYFELFVVAAVFLYRPTFAVIFNGQILAFLFLFLNTALLLFERHRDFWGGFVLCALALKPNIGFSFLFLIAIWMLIEKQGKGIAGLAAGCSLLFLLGWVVNAQWVSDYLQVGGDAFNKYLESVPTLWGALNRLFRTDRVGFAASLVAVLLVLSIEIFILMRAKSSLQPLEVFASIIPAALLVAPYAWSHDQIFLVIPLLYIVFQIATTKSEIASVFALFAAIALAIVLALIAHALLHDVWSFLNSLLVWAVVLYFMHRNFTLEKLKGKNVTISN
jgi:alpha-1,2-mannosyltransferase